MRQLILWGLVLLLAGSPAYAAADKRIALSFDDVPRQRGAFFTPDQRGAKLIAELKRARVRQAVFFVTPGNLAKPDGAGGERRIAAYAEAGHLLANHSFAHRPLSQTPTEDYLADIDRAEAWLKGRRGYRPWFRFPFLNEGRGDKARRDAVRAGLASRGLRNGTVTADGADWHLETLTIEAARAGEPMDMAALRDLYVETMVGAADYNDALARRTLGRPIPHMLLLHETDLAALFIGDLAAGLRRAGWQIVGADAVYRDEVFARAPDVPSAQGTLTEALAWEKGLPAPRWFDRVDPRVTTPLFRARVLKEAAK